MEEYVNGGELQLYQQVKNGVEGIENFRKEGEK